MAQRVTLGGDRLGSGNKQKVTLHGFERSTHDLSYLWRSTMSPGTLVPFLAKPMLPGDTFDIQLGCDIKTHPTIGPLFGSYKVQLDIFECPMRLYIGVLHNNKLGIGMDMAQVKLPFLKLFTRPGLNAQVADPDNAQINPSHIFSHLNIRGVGSPNDAPGEDPISRNFNGLSILGYWDIYKNYYANKQEEIGYVIHKAVPGGTETVTLIQFAGSTIPQAPTNSPVTISPSGLMQLTYTGGTGPSPENIYFNTQVGPLTWRQLIPRYTDSGTQYEGSINPQYANVTLFSWNYGSTGAILATSPQLQSFQLSSIDQMREAILQNAILGLAFDIFDENIEPWSFLKWDGTGASPYLNNQEGLAIKTYQSDLFNNWLQTEWIDGVGGITEVTAIDTSGGSFTIDTLNLSKKVYNMLNRIAVSGGTYDDWLDVQYDHQRIQRPESPIYHGGLIKELVFQEVVSNSAASPDGTSQQPLGTLAGKGIMASKHKGGNITIKCNEPSYLIGIISLTPRIDYSQGNDWDTHLETIDDLHKPMLDEIGFQELITEQMAWFATYWDNASTSWKTRSAGKQPAWINYMTDINKTRGNFAIKTNEMFMTLNRRYEGKGPGGNVNEIADLTTYIDPVKFNQIFAESAIDSQNFWAQIAVNITARRKMSAKIMPNL